MHLASEPSETMPYRSTTLGCLNCAIIAASCRNLTLSSCSVPELRVLMATSIGGALLFFHTPMLTSPKWPFPMWFLILYKTGLILHLFPLHLRLHGFVLSDLCWSSVWYVRYAFIPCCCLTLLYCYYCFTYVYIMKVIDWSLCFIKYVGHFIWPEAYACCKV